MLNEQFRLKFKGKTVAFVDWANVYGWKKSLKKEVDANKLFEYLKGYKEVKEIRFYFGSDNNKGSRKFMRLVKKVGYSVVTKPVKYILIEEVKDNKVFKRKCDFDLEISIDVHKALGKKYDSFVFFTGDGDFEPLYQLLVNLKKQVIVIFASGHLGREIYQIEKKIYIKPVHKLGVDLFSQKNIPPVSWRA